MWRKAFLLLLTLPLLPPPGVCLCQVRALAPRAAGQAEGPARAPEEAAPATTCRCRHCRADEKKPTPSPGKDGEDGTREPPSPSPDPQHAPGCPAHPSYAVSRVPAPTVPPSADLPATGPCTWLAPAPVDQTVGALGGPACPPALPPIFLLFCAFRC